MKIYVVSSITGEYEDTWTSLEKAFLTEEKALAYKQKKELEDENLLKELTKKYNRCCNCKLNDIKPKNLEKNIPNIKCFDFDKESYIEDKKDNCLCFSNNYCNNFISYIDFEPLIYRIECIELEIEEKS